MDTEEYVKIPEYFYKFHKSVMLTADVMFVNRSVFMVTSSRKIKYVTVKRIPSQTSEQRSKILNKLIKLYGKGGFIISMIHMYIDFYKVDEIVVNIEVILPLQC